MRPDLLELVLKHDELAELDAAERRLALRDLLARNGSANGIARAVTELADAIDGFGPLTSLMEDDLVSDVLVNGPHEVWVERAGSMVRTPIAFSSTDELLSLIDRLLARAGARADVEHPVADARLEDGSRIHVVLPPVAPYGPLVSIRRFRKAPWTLDDLLAEGMMSRQERVMLAQAVKGRSTIAISGGTGCGKTTLLNALLGEIDSTERVVLIEETQELRPPCEHHVSLLSRVANIEGRGALDVHELVRAALRMRPDRIVVGEARGSEALAALAAMSVGHKGSMVTVHARSAADVVDRLVSLSLQEGSGATEFSLRRQVDMAFDLFVHLDRSDKGRRKVVEIQSR